jgi:hypothetical protein
MQAGQVIEIGPALSQGTVAELEKVREDSTAGVLDRWLATLISQAMQKGDVSILKVVLDRLVGKAAEEKNFDPATATALERPASRQ